MRVPDGLLGVAALLSVASIRGAAGVRNSHRDQVQDLIDCLLGVHSIAEHHFAAKVVEETPGVAKKGMEPVCAFFLTANAGGFFASRYGIKAVRNTHLAGSVLLDDLEKFEYINKTVSAKLQVTTEKGGRVRINRRLFGLLEPLECAEKVQRRIGDLRSVIEWMHKSARVWADTVARSPPEDIIAPSLDSNQGCEGRNLRPELLPKDFGVASPAGGWCRDFSEENKTQVQRACAEKCLQIEGCAGVTWYDSEVEPEEIRGSRCCFREETSSRFEQDNTTCFVASRARFLELDAKGFAGWLKAQGLGRIAPGALKLGANGILMQGLTKPKMLEWLSTENATMLDAEALELRCRINAELLGTPHRRRLCGLKGLTARGMQAFKRVAGKVEPLGFAVRAARGAWREPWWRADLVRRLLPEGSAGKQIIADGLNAYYTIIAMRCVRDAVDSFFGSDAFFCKVGLGLSVAALAGRASESFWDRCYKVEGLLDEKLLSPFAVLVLSNASDITSPSAMF